jgi:hypothetical protein
VLWVVGFYKGFYKGDEPDLSKFIILGQMQYIGSSSSLWLDKIALEHAILVLDHIFAPFSVSTAGMSFMELE